MFDKLIDLEKRYIELSDKINDPEIISNNEEWRKLMKEHSDISPIVSKYKEYEETKQAIEDAKEMLNENDEEIRQLAKEELNENTERLEEIKEELKILLIPKDPNDDKNVIVEIRGGAGGDEANIFAGDLYRMYSRYAERRRWKTEIMSSTPSDMGGFKEISFMIMGQGAYSRLKYESGVHRVQRVPDTESSGRIHTSTVTVAVLPEVEDIDFKLDLNDVRIDVFRASGNGGQCVNTTDSAVRATHLPTGIVVSCQDEKSQLKNKEKALKVLASRLYDMELEKQHAELSAERKSQVGRGNRNERIRTYNFPQGRVTDHRVGLTLHRLDAIIDGDLDEIMDTLITTEQAEKLKEGSENI
ncbi:peptide chain release factor 1 [uncultured Tyzzerella sp.]|uniref:peptide chain release factor 1 n=1 Tax=uncultured Tyzzerella sp. TaxID=2321398 RepID=UPI0029423AB0|nr:peptide chain release factor 1 [uncultured Tyzzerella sp.]